MSGKLNAAKDGCIDTVPGDQSKGFAHVWRNFLQIPFIEEDFYQKNIKSIRKESLCIPIELRVEPSKSYSIATRENIPKLFLPVITISKIYKQIDGNEINKAQPTDFFKPSIEVSIKSSTDQQEQIMSLDIDEEEIDTTLKVDFMGNDYEQLVKIKKTTNMITKQPLLCLYKSIIDNDGESKDVKLKCINRKYPELKKVKIDNTKIIEMPIITENILDGFHPGYKDTYDKFKMNFQIQSLHNNAKTKTVALNIPDVNSIQSSCADLEGVKFCTQREECSQYELEYIQNEFAIHDKRKANEPLDREYDIRQNIKASLKNKCERKKALSEMLIVKKLYHKIAL